MNLSVIIPALNERQALPGLFEEIKSACEDLPGTLEILVVDDGSTDGTMEMLQELSATDPSIVGIGLRRNFGKAVALAQGFSSATGEIFITMDGDGQDDPADIPKLLAELDSGYDLVSGWKQDRQDPASRRWASKVFNGATARFTGVRMHDMNCGFKVYRRQCARSLDVYGEMHRFLPALAAQNGWRVTEIPVNHRAREHGSSRYGLERYMRGALDLMTVAFLGRYQHRPLHFFGAVGGASTVVGVLICLYLTLIWIGGSQIGDRPLLMLGVLLTVVGVQFLCLGLLGQMLVLMRHGAQDQARDAEFRVESVVRDGSGQSAMASSR